MAEGGQWVGGWQPRRRLGWGRLACSHHPSCVLLRGVLSAKSTKSSFSQSQCISWGIKMSTYPTNATLSTLQSEEEHRHRLEGESKWVLNLFSASSSLKAQ